MPNLKLGFVLLETGKIRNNGLICFLLLLMTQKPRWIKLDKPRGKRRTSCPLVPCGNRHAPRAETLILGGFAGLYEENEVVF